MLAYKEYETITLFDDNRFYDLHDRCYPSITTVLSGTDEDTAWLTTWRANVGQEQADKVLAKACDRGTNVHLLLERFLKQEPLQLDSFQPMHQRLFKQLKPLTAKINKIYGQEVVLYSDTLQVAGRCDLVGEWEGIPSIIDFKTSIKPKFETDIEDYYLQTTFYAEAHNEMFGTGIKQVVILMAVEKGLPLLFKHPITKEFKTKVAARASKFYKQLARMNL